MKSVCPHSKRCPGCTKLAVPYPKQVADKARLVADRLSPLAALKADRDEIFRPMAESPKPLGYRSSTKLCLDMDTFGQRRIGLYERASKAVVDIPDCPVHHPEINKLVAKLFGGNAPLPAPFYGHAKRAFQPGCLKFVTVRVNSATGMTGLVLSHTGVDRKVLADWAAKLDVRRLSLYECRLRKDDDDQVMNDDVRHLAGAKTFAVEILGRKFQLSPAAFFQANESLTDLFVATATEGLAGNLLLDLYGGFGAYSVAASKNFRRSLVVDGNRAAVESIKETCAALGISSITGLTSSVEDFLAKRIRPEERQEVTHVIVNPPRQGLSDVVREAIGKAQFPDLKEVVYVSCDLATLARDLEVLTRKGRLRLVSVTPFDMFPQTDHVEVVARLRA